MVTEKIPLILLLFQLHFNWFQIKMLSGISGSMKELVSYRP